MPFKLSQIEKRISFEKYLSSTSATDVASDTSKASNREGISAGSTGQKVGSH